MSYRKNFLPGRTKSRFSLLWSPKADRYTENQLRNPRRTTVPRAIRERQERQASPSAPVKNPKALKTANDELADQRKTSFTLSAESKFKLSTLKAELRRRGHRITESFVVEQLIENASSGDLLKTLAIERRDFTGSAPRKGSLNPPGAARATA
jgi:hypothetical protein